MRHAGVARGHIGSNLVLRRSQTMRLLLRAYHEPQRDQRVHGMHRRFGLRRRYTQLQLWLLRSLPRGRRGGGMSYLKRKTLGHGLVAMILLVTALQGCGDSKDNPTPPAVTSGGSNITGGKNGQSGSAGKSGDNKAGTS